MRVRTRKAWPSFNLAGALSIRSSPLPSWASILIALFVTVSAFDDLRLFVQLGQDWDSRWWELAGTICYWVLWMTLAFRPQLTAVAFLALLTTMYVHEQPGGALLVAFSALAVAAYRVSTRNLAVMVGGFLAWQLVWVLGVSSLGSAALWGYFPATLLITTPGLAIKLLREKSVQTEQAQRAAKETAATAALAQRTELARELHDVVTHGLTMIAVQANLGKISTEGQAQDHALTEIGSMARSSLDDLRRLLQTMRNDDSPVASGADTSVSPSSATIDLARSVAESQKQLNNLGFPTRVTTTGELDRTPNGLRSTVLRILQESATNVVRHTGGSSECEISMNVQDEHIELIIRNRMTPGKPRLPISGTGLIGLRERASRLGGTLDAGPVDGWWNVRTVLPFKGRQLLR
ncbi:sensor histidine kinase [Arthrobacter sp. TMN-49]